MAAITRTIGGDELELTILMPCLNEESAIQTYVRKARQALDAAQIKGEVLVVDNGSVNRSAELAREAGARVVYEPQKGYGNAYLRGFKEARGRYVVIGDSDGTYDFSLVPQFLAPLRDGRDYLMRRHQENSPDIAALPACTVIIPAYNEEEGLGVVLQKLFNAVDENYEVIVVDDGSTDRTEEIASRFPCQVISHGINRGKAAAVKTGIAAARGRNLVFIDADDTYPVELVPEIACAVDEFDMVVTSRVEGRENIPLLNRLGNRVFCALICYLYGFMTSDPLTGFYGVKKSVLLNMNLDSSGFGVETELAIKSGRMGLKVREIPIKYRPRIGESKLHATRDGLRVLKTIFKALALFSPTFFFVFPGAMLLGLGMLLMALLTIGPVTLGSITLRSNTFTLAAMLSLAGFQAVVFGIGLDLYASAHRFARPGRVTRLLLKKYINGNTGRFGSLLVLVGIGIQSWLGYDWMHGGFGAFSRTNELVASSFLAVIGLQVAFSSSFLSVFVSAMRDASSANGGT